MSWFGRILNSDGDQHERIVATSVIRSYAEAGSGGETVVTGLPWREGALHPETPTTLSSAEVEQHHWFGSYELKEPGR